MDILFGIGNPLRGDDGVGIYIAENLDSEGWMSIDCGTVPENFTSVVKEKRPKNLVLVDSAEMGLMPGEARRIPKGMISSLGFGTHSLPLSQLMSYLEPYAERIIFIGIQPKEIADKTELSIELTEAADELIRKIKDGRFGEIEELSTPESDP